MQNFHGGIVAARVRIIISGNPNSRSHRGDWLFSKGQKTGVGSGPGKIPYFAGRNENQ